MTAIGAPAAGASTMTAIGAPAGAPAGASTMTAIGGAPAPAGASTMTAIGGAPAEIPENYKSLQEIHNQQGDYNSLYKMTIVPSVR
ncbi:unnamed protein product [Strongylus vulgaris]|uniref:Uncharacterized protein n=1 Tax=Strongylus vulgaris TaxID=40348 RepID=A0A3P7JWF3_STRVU|nr:unnamed protein product [Strongylus vulgaris]